MTEKDSRFCLRCRGNLEYAGNKRFHEGDNWGVIGEIGEFLVDEVSFDMFVCPDCGQVESFAQIVGRESRPH